MNTVSPSAPDPTMPDPTQKKRLILGVCVWAAGVLLSLGLIPVVNATTPG
jgi:hypothetical protein